MLLLFCCSWVRGFNVSECATFAAGAGLHVHLLIVLTELSDSEYHHGNKNKQRCAPKNGLRSEFPKLVFCISALQTQGTATKLCVDTNFSKL